MEKGVVLFSFFFLKSAVASRGVPDPPHTQIQHRGLAESLLCVPGVQQLAFTLTTNSHKQCMEITYYSSHP